MGGWFLKKPGTRHPLFFFVKKYSAPVFSPATFIFKPRRSTLGGEFNPNSMPCADFIRRNRGEEITVKLRNLWDQAVSHPGQTKIVSTKSMFPSLSHSAQQPESFIFSYRVSNFTDSHRGGVATVSSPVPPIRFPSFSSPAPKTFYLNLTRHGARNIMP